MNRTILASSYLRAVGYDPAQQRLEVEFIDGALYQYERVPPALYAGLLTASSPGRYFARHIRDQGYRQRRIR